MNIAVIVVELVGSLGLFLYGMKILSEGVQRAAGDGLKRTLNMMTGSTPKALLTGVIVTALVQSSSATTVMVISFVNAGLLSVVQAAGVIFGANIGTTVTAWIVSLVGFKFQISALALPMIGAGFILMNAFKRSSRLRDYGEAALGFGLLFLGLDFLSHAIPKPSAEVVYFLEGLGGHGVLSILIAVLTGLVLTVLVHSSSASTAIVITLAVDNIIGFEMAAGLVLGCNIGTTIDAFLASIGSKTAAKRAAWIHILFNVAGSLWAIAFFKPFLALVNLLAGSSTVAQHIAMMHTVFNVINALLFAPFAGQIAALVTRLVKDRPGEDALPSRLEYVAAPLMGSTELNMLRAQKEISDMAGLCGSMFGRWRELLVDRPADLSEDVSRFKELEEYADQMRDELSRFLLDCAGHDMSAERQRDVGTLLRMVVDLEDITDGCFNLILLLEKAGAKKLSLDKEEVSSLGPYTLLVENFLGFVKDNINGPITEAQLEAASALENSIDEFRSSLKKKARKRLQRGADVKAELLFIDIVRHVEKIGDHAYGVAHALRELR